LACGLFALWYFLGLFFPSSSRQQRGIIGILDILEKQPTYPEGILRVDGDNTLVGQIFQSLMKNPKAKIPSTTTESDLTSVLKRLIREYPGGVIPTATLRPLLEAEAVGTEFTLELAGANKEIFDRIVGFAAMLVARHQETTKMTAYNFAVILAPTVTAADGAILLATKFEKSVPGVTILIKFLERIINQKALEISSDL
jgi:hypothetical protein